MKSMQLLVFAAILLTATWTSSATETSVQSAHDAELQVTLAKQAEAATLFLNGNPEAAKALWSHSDDVTLSGGHGGATARGWSNVSSRLDWASSQYVGANGSKTAEPIQTTVSGDLAYVVQYEHDTYHPAGQPMAVKKDLRATMIFRRGPEGWRLVHRHADALMTRHDGL